MKKNVGCRMTKAIVLVAKKMEKVEANTTCPCLNYQKKESKTVKALRKF